MRNKSKFMATGGVTAALAAVIMSLGGMIPIATYICPTLCALLLLAVLRICGNRIAWSWYAAVSLLSVLLCPDKEAAAVFVFLGYYPIVKPWLDRRKLSFLWKAALFNGATALMYGLLMVLIGMEDLTAEFQDAGAVLLAVMLLMGNLTFFMLDRLLFLLRKRFQ